jgi:hypothetical protein
MDVLLRSYDRDGMAAHFHYQGRARAPLQDSRHPTNPPADAAGEPNRKEDVVANDNNLAAGLRERFGLPADATDELLLAKVDETLAKDQKPTIPEGTVLLDKGQPRGAAVRRDGGPGGACTADQGAS